MHTDRIILFPYYAILSLRNFLFDRNILKHHSFDTPTICVGNITVGGTGKTPHVEFLINSFKDQYKIAVISAGYKRKTKGNIEVQCDDNYKKVGDEPLQIKNKFPDIRVIVDKSRKRAIKNLESLPEGEKPDLIILDDAFQHRAIKPTLSILLVNNKRPIFEDSLLPIGRLRDLPNQIRRADIAIITKLDEIEESEREEWRKRIHLSDKQKIYFSKYKHNDLTPVFSAEGDIRYAHSKESIVVAGIADTRVLENSVVENYRIKEVIRFADHHEFKNSEIKKIEKIATKKFPRSIIITTEKDAQRLKHLSDIPESLKKRLFYIPIEVEMIPVTDPSLMLIPSEISELGKKEFIKAVKAYL